MYALRDWRGAAVRAVPGARPGGGGDPFGFDRSARATASIRHGLHSRDTGRFLERLSTALRVDGSPVTLLALPRNVAGSAGDHPSSRNDRLDL